MARGWWSRGSRSAVMVSSDVVEVERFLQAGHGDHHPSPGLGKAYLHDARYCDTLDDEAEPVLDVEQPLAVNLRHAQDVEYGNGGPNPPPLSESTLTFVSWLEPPTAERPGRTLLDVIVPTPSERLAVGDPEYMIYLPVWAPATWVRVSGTGASWGVDYSLPRRTGILGLAAGSSCFSGDRTRGDPEWLTSPPQASPPVVATARPAARMFLAAFSSRSCRV
ncbi:MAG: hypothetical protein QG671_2329, partial [Actinomycetota bacterium]|nr:hypothetical protein [Actinomycetota bacterium]